MNESRVDVARARKDAACREGLNEAEFLDRLGEPAEAVMGRLSTPPAWMTTLARAYARAASSPQPGMPPGQAMSEFLGFVGPLIEQGQEHMHQGINEIINQYKFHQLDPDSVEALLLANLPGQLLRMVDRTLVLELNVARLQGTLPGETTEERFRSFVGACGGPRSPWPSSRSIPSWPAN